MPGDVRLAMDMAAAAKRLRDGVGLDGERRAQLVDLLMRAAFGELARGRPIHLDADPGVLVEIAVTTAREAGMAAPDIVATVNDALEATVGPEPLRTVGAR